MIRPAVHDDVATIVQLGQQMHGESNYWPVPYDIENTASFVHDLVDSQDGFAYVSLRDGVINGFMLGMAYPAWWSDGVNKVVGDFGLYVEPGSRHGTVAVFLASAFKDWAKAQGAWQIRVGTSAGEAGQAANTIYRHLGFRHVGENFVYDARVQPGTQPESADPLAADAAGRV